MPPIRTSRNRKPPPAGFEDIEDTLLEFSNKMKDAENASHEGKKRHEVLWPIFQISHQRESSFTVGCYGKEDTSLHEAFCPFRQHTDGRDSEWRFEIHIWVILPEASYIEATVRLAAEEQLRRCQLDRQVEEAGIRKGTCVFGFLENRMAIFDFNWHLSEPSFAVYDASRRRRRILMPHVSAEFRKHNWKRIRQFNVWIVGVEVVLVVISPCCHCLTLQGVRVCG